MIDFFCKWATEADAMADAEMLAEQAHVSFNTWRTDHVLPNVQVWRPSQDVITGTPPDQTITHTYLTGWFAIVSTKGKPAALMSLPATQFVLDRDGPPYVILNNIGTVINDITVSPIFAGSHYPMNG